LICLDAVHDFKGFDYSNVYGAVLEDVDINLQVCFMRSDIERLDVSIIVAAHFVPDLSPMVVEERGELTEAPRGISLMDFFLRL
jgi:hypothetical protein